MDSTLRDELRRSNTKGNSIAPAGREQSWRQAPMLPGVVPLAGALARGRGNGPVRAEAMRNAQSTYGNRSVQRSLKGRAPVSPHAPVQRVIIPGEVSDD